MCITNSATLTSSNYSITTTMRSPMWLTWSCNSQSRALCMRESKHHMVHFPKQKSKNISMMFVKLFPICIAITTCTGILKYAILYAAGKYIIGFGAGQAMRFWVCCHFLVQEYTLWNLWVHGSWNDYGEAVWPQSWYLGVGYFTFRVNRR